MSRAARPRVGILGGGQLALMLAESLIALGADPAIYEPDAEAPARRRYASGVSRPYEDRAALRAFLDACDVVTYEFENVPAAAIVAAASVTPIVPSLDVLATCQHRVREKNAVRAAKAPTVSFLPVRERDELVSRLRAFGVPAIVKTAEGGYDGHGQRRYRHLSEVDPAHFPAGAELVIEEPIDILLEVSCIVARRGRAVTSLPLFENQHRAHILDVTLCPARIPGPAAKKIRAVAHRLATSLEVEGLVTVEFFIGHGRAGHGAKLPGMKGARLYVNELAPRPHNSGHVSRIACDHSQFDLHARAVLGMKLPGPSLLQPRQVAFMANLIGDRWPVREDEVRVFGELGADRAVRELYLYGKTTPRAGRKMGHVSGMAASHRDALGHAARLRRRAGLSGPRDPG